MDGITRRLSGGIDLNRRLALRVPETAELLGLSRSKTYELIGRGVIPSIQLDGSIRVPVEGLRELVKV